MTAGAAFDAIASQYNTLWDTSPIGRAQRDQVWHVIDRLFQPGNVVVDLGCGTGEDALHLARRGVRVHAFDASAKMAAQARSHGVAAEQLAIEEAAGISGSFDGALSNFGALNCVQDLRPVAVSLERLLRPRGYAALCFLNRTCAWEIAHYAGRGRFRTAFRRLRSRGLDTSLGLKVWYPRPGDIRRAFAPEFELVAMYGIGVVVPPSYVKLPPSIVRTAAGVDSLLSAFPPAARLADHTLYVFRRRTEC